MEFATLCEEAKSGVTKLNWESTKTAFSSAFKTMTTADVSTLVMLYIKLYLPKFLEKNPQETWVNERVMTIERVLGGEMDPEELSGFPDYTRKLEDPLARGFTSAIGSCWRMAKAISNPNSFAEFATDTISMIFTLLRYEYRDWIPAGYEHLRSDEKGSLEYQADLWCDLADKLMTLSRPPH